MKNIRIDGSGSVTEGEYGSINIDGLGKCTGKVIAEKIRVDGSFQCEDDIVTKSFIVDGITNCNGNVKASLIDIDGKWKCLANAETDRMNCDGMAEVKGNIRAQKVENDGLLKAGKIEAEEIDCDGVLSVAGQISADILKADGFVSAEEIVGDSITIKSKKSKLVQLFMKGSSKIGLIEATTIYLKGVHAKTVNGSNITIDAGCEIEKIDCSGILEIDPKAKVGEITGEYQRR